jgi:hypothetical protein
MHVLVVATPQHPIPPTELPGMVDAATDWHERHKDELQAFGLFPGGGGFGIVEADDAAAINQLILEMPFSPFSHHEIRPFVPGEAGLAQLREAIAAQATR